MVAVQVRKQPTLCGLPRPIWSKILTYVLVDAALVREDRATFTRCQTLLSHVCREFTIIVEDREFVRNAWRFVYESGAQLFYLIS